MDQRTGEKEHNSEDSWDHRRKDTVDAAAEGLGINNHGVASMDHQSDGAGYDYEEAEDETLKEVEVEVVGGGSDEEASATPLLAHPCSMLQLLLRACAGCLSLYGYGYCCDDDDDVASAAESTQEGDHQGGGDKAAGDLCMQEVDTQVRAARRRPPPPPSGRPREGPGGNGGNHH